jgi:hypothetical protein
MRQTKISLEMPIKMKLHSRGSIAISANGGTTVATVALGVHRTYYADFSSLMSLTMIGKQNNETA